MQPKHRGIPRGIPLTRKFLYAIISIEMDEKKLKNACKTYGIAFLGVFGSYARGDQTPASDLDLLVKFTQRKSLLDMVRIEREMSDSLGLKVDLLTEKSISPYLKDKIKEGLKVIYDNKR